MRHQVVLPIVRAGCGSSKVFFHTFIFVQGMFDCSFLRLAPTLKAEVPFVWLIMTLLLDKLHLLLICSLIWAYVGQNDAAAEGHASDLNFEATLNLISFSQAVESGIFASLCKHHHYLVIHALSAVAAQEVLLC